MLHLENAAALTNLFSVSDHHLVCTLELSVIVLIVFIHLLNQIKIKLFFNAVCCPEFPKREEALHKKNGYPKTAQKGNYILKKRDTKKKKKHKRKKEMNERKVENKSVK